VDPAQLVPYLTGPAAAVMILLWWVWTLRKDIETERAAHDKTREALAIASARADAGVRAAELIASAVEGARHAPQAPQVP
jgi:hypothetical protein